MNKTNNKNNLPKIALVGAGNWGLNWARVLYALPECDFLVCVESDLHRQSWVQVACPGITITDNLESVLSDSSIDGMIVATPPPTHFQIAKDAIEAGKDVLVEKPLATSEVDAQVLVTLAEEYGNILMVGHLLLYHPCITKIKGLLNQGELGYLHYAYCQRLNLGVIRTEESALWSFAPHDVSVISYLKGEWPIGVTALGMDYLQESLEDVVFVNLHYQDNFVANLHLSWLDPHKIRKITLVGSRKMVAFDDMETQDKIRIYDKGADSISEGSYDNFWTIRYGDTLIPAISSEEPLKIEAREFLDCIRTRNTPKTTGYDGLQVVSIIEAAEHSMRNNSIYVELPVSASK